MSYTQTCISSSGSASTSTFRLTPRKRKQLDHSQTNSEVSSTHKQNQSCQAKEESFREKILRCRGLTTHSLTELYKWTFNRAAVAPVRARHVFEMDHERTDPEEFFWMGRVPCRTVKLVGMVVGIDEFDDTTRFKLDDGTAVIDCDLKRPKPFKQRTPTKTTNDRSASNTSAPESSKQALSRQKLPRNSEVGDVFVGSILSVRGRIFHGRGTRYLRIDADGFSLCRSPNDEPSHWMNVNRLCREYYYSPEPFVIPRTELKSDRPHASSSNDSTLTTPSSPVSTLSPNRSESSRASASSPRAPRLRHPSRLHSRDLTDVTFRIYLKHYMDFASPYHPTQATTIKHEDDEDDSCDPFSTPTPKSRHRRYSSLETPRPDKSAARLKQSEDETVAMEYGFTLSYLRRVPVLSEMTRAVVRAEAKRREKAKLKRGKEKTSQNNQVSSSSPKPSARGTSRSAPGSELDPKLVSINMKRLFQKTIRDLYKDGGIIIWNGPSRPCEHAFYANDESIGGSQGLWKTKDTQPSPTNTTTSSFNSRFTQGDLDGSLSEPDENEESYLPVSTRIIAPFVMRALRNLTGLENASRKPSRKYRPPTAEELAAHLRRSDAQWDNLGSWDVQASLEWLQNEDRVFKAGDGRWAVCS